MIAKSENMAAAQVADVGQARLSLEKGDGRVHIAEVVVPHLLAGLDPVLDPFRSAVLQRLAGRLRGGVQPGIRRGNLGLYRHGG